MKLGIVMDPISGIKVNKDSSFAMLLEAQARAYEIYYMEPLAVKIINGKVLANAAKLKVQDRIDSWYEFIEQTQVSLASMDVILIRNDPPFASNYLYLTQMLELVEKAGVLIVNRPQAIRDFNEKLAVNIFPELAPPACVSSKIADFKEFLKTQQKIVVKPLDAMGGRSIFVIDEHDVNTNVILETITENETKLVMAQKFLPEIKNGDKRILLIDGKPVPYSLARIPGKGDFRGNLARGARAVGEKLNKKEYAICEELAQFLRANGLLFVGIDIIGDYLTEINVTSPTGIRELDKIFQLNIAGTFFDSIEAKLS